MAQLAMGIAGGILGSFVGMPQLGFMAGSLLGGALFGGSGSKGGPRLADLHVTSSTYGSIIPWGWGTARIGGNVIWSYPLTEHSHSGKGFGNSSYTYSWTGAVGICSTEYTGPISRILKIWADTKLVYDCTGQSGLSRNIPGSGGGKGGSDLLPGGSVVNGDVLGAFNKVGKFRLYQGTQDQFPDAALEALVGSANAQAHRGMAYIVFDDIDLTNYGSRVPNWTFEVAFSDSTFTQNAFKFDPDTSVLLTPASYLGVLDAFRRRVYFFNVGNGGQTDKGIHAFNLKDASEYMYSSYSRTFAGDASQGFDPENEGAIIGDDGYLWIQSSGAQWVKIDPDSLLEVGSISYSGTASLGPVPMKLSGLDFLFSVDTGAGGGQCHLFNLDLLTEKATGSVPGGLFLRVLVCGGNQIDADTGLAFALHGSNLGSASLTFYSFELTALTTTPITPTNTVTILPGDIDSDWTQFDSFTRLVFDATDGTVMFFAQWNNAGSPGHHRQYLVKLNAQTGSIVWVSPWENTADSSKSLPSDIGANQTVITSGIYSVFDGNNQMWTFSTQDGSSTKTLWPSNTTSNSYQVWNDSLGALLTYGVFDTTEPAIGWTSDHHQVLIAGAQGSGTPLSTIVTEICEPCGLVSGDIDVSALTDNVEGYILTNQMTGADGIKPLATAFLFDHNVSDNVLRFVKRGGASARTVPNTSLAIVDTKNNLFVQETRTQEVDLPYQIALNFLDPNHNYQQAIQYARRIVNPYPTMYSKQTHTENMALVAEPEFMRQLAEKLLYTAWLNRTAYRTKMSWDQIDLDPTDVVTITDTDGTTFLTRTVQQSIGADLSLVMDNVAESTPTYTSAAVTDGGLGFNQQNLIPSVDTRLFLIDAPLLRDVDDTGQSYTILYDAASSYAAGTWSGTTVWKSSDAVNYSNEGTIPTAQACSWGTAMNALSDLANPFAIDNVNTLTLQMAVGGTNLASDTLLNVCNGANAGILLNSDGTVEIIQWLTRTLNADGSYTLSQLLRGRRGTEVFTGNHAIGDVFILLTTNTVESIKMALSDINMDRFYKPVTAGTLFSSVAYRKFASEGRAWKPYAPGHITATLSGSDINLAWVRRTRVGGELMPFTGIVPLSEQFESYEVDIYDALGDTVLRTLRVDYGAGPTSSPGVTYLAADIATDFGSTPATLNVAVYQISATVGRGFGKLINITVA